MYANSAFPTVLLSLVSIISRLSVIIYVQFLRVPGFGGKIGDEYRKNKAVNRKRSTYIMHSGYRIIQLWCLNT